MPSEPSPNEDLRMSREDIFNVDNYNGVVIGISISDVLEDGEM